MMKLHTSKQTREQQCQAEATRIQTQIQSLQAKLAKLEAGVADDEARMDRLEDQIVEEAGPSHTDLRSRQDLFFMLSSR